MFEFVEEKAIEISRIIALDEAQPRLKLSTKIINEYIQSLTIEGWEEFEPIIVFSRDGEFYYLADGFHRLNAHLEIHADLIKAKIFVGADREAILYSCGANNNHGLRRSNQDRENAVLKLLRDKEWSKWNDVQLAKCANCCSTTIANIAKRHGIERPSDRLVNSRGKVQKISTKSVGRKTNIPKQIEKTASQLAAKIEKAEDKESYLSQYFELLSQKLNIQINFSLD